MSFYKKQLVDWLRKKDFKSGKVLSIGCQEDDRRYFKSFKAKEFLTFDNNLDLKPDIECGIECQDVPYIMKDDRDFDDIFTFELWEYLTSPRRALKHLNYMLKKGGKLWISAPFIYPLHNPEKEDMLRYTVWFWERVLPEMGFKIIEYKDREWFDSDGYLDSVGKDKMRPTKNYNHNITGHLIIAEKIKDF